MSVPKVIQIASVCPVEHQAELALSGTLIGKQQLGQMFRFLLANDHECQQLDVVFLAMFECLQREAVVLLLWVYVRQRL